jgi:hypothetical protein
MVATRRGVAARKAVEPESLLSELKRTINEIGLLPGWEDEDYQAALVMLASVGFGDRDPDVLSRFTGVPLPMVKEIYGRLLENGVWGLDSSLNAEWMHPEHGKQAFRFDVFVASGKLRRAR